MTYTSMPKVIVTSLAIAGVAFFATAKIAMADTNCTTQYGANGYGTTNCTTVDITVNKTVKNPVSNVFVENLTDKDATYSPDSEVTFQLEIKNAGNQNFDTVTVKDVLPEHLTNASVDAQYNGSYDSGSKTLTFTLKDLKSGESKTVEVKAKVTAASTFAKDKDMFCETNKAEVTANDRKDDDTAQYCIRTNVLGVTTLPEAGVADYLPLVPIMAIGLFGIGLLTKKKTV